MGYLLGGENMTGSGIARAVLQINNARQIVKNTTARPCINKNGTTAQRGTVITYAELTTIEKLLKDACDSLLKENNARPGMDNVKCVHGITFSNHCAQCANENVEQSLKDARAELLKERNDSSGINADDDRNRSL